jgi:hypothetical protein
MSDDLFLLLVFYFILGVSVSVMGLIEWVIFRFKGDGDDR